MPKHHVDSVQRRWKKGSRLFFRAHLGIPYHGRDRHDSAHDPKSRQIVGRPLRSPSLPIAPRTCRNYRRSFGWQAYCNSICTILPRFIGWQSLQNRAMIGLLLKVMGSQWRPSICRELGLWRFASSPGHLDVNLACGISPILEIFSPSSCFVFGTRKEEKSPC